MATPTLVPTATEPKGLNTMKSLVEGIFPPNFGDPNAENIAQQNLKKMDVVIPTLKEDSKNPAPPIPEAIKTPVAPTPEVIKTPEPVKEVLTEATPLDDALLKAVAIPEVTPEVPLVEGKEAPIVEPVTEEIPKTAKAQQEALIKMRKLLGDKEKKIKELEAKGSIDVAATATEPLRQRIAELEQREAQALNQVAATSILNHPEVQRQYIKPMQLAENFINELAKSNDSVSSRELLKIANEPDHVKRKAAVKAACSELDPDDMIQARQAVDALHDLGVGLDNIKANASKIAAQQEQVTQQQAAAQQAEFRSRSVKAHDEIYSEFSSNPLIKHFADTNPEFKKKIENIHELAKQAEVDTSWLQNDKQRAKLIQNGLAYKPVSEALQGQIGQLIKDKKDLLLQVQNLKRGAGVTTQPRTNNYQAPVSDKPVSVESIVKGTFAGVNR